MRSSALLALTASLLTVGAAPEASAGPVYDLVTSPVRAIFKSAAEKKGDRVFHATGAAYHATIASKDGSTRPAIVRVSRGGASKSGRPDILGVAVKVKEPGGDQDFLLVTALGERGLAARVPAFRGAFAGQAISSLTSFRTGASKGPISARLPANFHTKLDLAATPGATRSRFALSLQNVALFSRARAKTALGTVTVHFDQPLTTKESAGLRYSIFNEASDIHPAGLVNALRKAAYLGSQSGRGL